MRKMENEVTYIRILPYVRVERIVKNGKESLVKIDNLSVAEISKMSVKMPKIFERNSDGIYVLDEPSITSRATGIRMLLAFAYDELTEDEQLKYFDRSILIPVIVKDKELPNKNTKNISRRRTKFK